MLSAPRAGQLADVTRHCQRSSPQPGQQLPQPPAEGGVVAQRAVEGDPMLDQPPLPADGPRHRANQAAPVPQDRSQPPRWRQQWPSVRCDRVGGAVAVGCPRKRPSVQWSGDRILRRLGTSIVAPKM